MNRTSFHFLPLMALISGKYKQKYVYQNMCIASHTNLANYREIYISFVRNLVLQQTAGHSMIKIGNHYKTYIYTCK
jgi:hypothetical protein